MKSIIMMLLLAFAVIEIHAQDSTKQTIKNIIDAKHYTFEPISMMPSRGGIKHLTSGYFFQLNGDTLKTYLPYIGRAYNAPIDPSDAGFDFTSTNFTYAVSEGKKNSYNISVKTKDKTYNTEFTLTVYDDGTAYLRANSSDKQPVSYSGSVIEKK